MVVFSAIFSLLFVATGGFDFGLTALGSGQSPVEGGKGSASNTALAAGGITIPSVLTQHNDTNRTGANLQETILNVSNVNSNSFGKLFTRTVDGGIYTQPLYVPYLTIGGRTRNVVYVATQNNSVYAFDADDPAASSPLWKVNLGTPPPKDDFGQNCGTYNDFAGNIGVISTPVIDPTSNTMYLVNMIKVNGVYSHQIHKLDILTGQEKSGSPVTISATVPGGGGTLTFNSAKQVQRNGLLLANGKLYFGFAGYCDTGPYHGWIFAYNASNLNQSAVFNTTPDGGAGGIWQAGGGMNADSNGNIYLMTGNGDFNANNGGPNYGSSFIKFDQNLTVLDYFTPYNVSSLNDQDLDLGSSGITMIPGTTLMVGGGKEGKLFLVDSTNLGGFTPNGPDQVKQSFQIVGSVTHNNLHGTPVYWNSSAGQRIYLWTESDRFKAFSFNAQANPPINTSPVMTGSTALPSGYMPGGMLSLSANGNDTSTGIIWASTPTSQNANNAVVAGTLRAYNASSSGSNITELWSSDTNSARDAVGYFGKFSSPTIVNGKVYLATLVPNSGTTGILDVYGLLPQTVTNSSDSGSTGSGNTSGTLSYALKNAPPFGQIKFQGVTNNTITVTGALPALKQGVIMDGGNCTSGPSLTINGSGVNANGLVLGGQNIFRNLKIVGFIGRQIYAPSTATGNVLGPCVSAKRNP
ncbi:MAG: hypothetical protein J0I20_06045 [Chloroflexi bacterium]|nr:hypothetical protein [Chloroflexota bacterium]